MNTQNSNINSVVANVSVENNTNLLRQITAKAKSNEALFKLIEQAISRKPVQLIVTPRVDVGGYPYYWIGVRFDYRELNFKLLRSNQIGYFILAYLRGDDTLPEVTEFTPTEKIEDAQEWLYWHHDVHSAGSISCREEISMQDGVNYITKKLIFKNGKINYPSTKCDDVLSLLNL